MSEYCIHRAILFNSQIQRPGCQRLIAIVNTHTGLLLMLYVSLIDYSVSYCPRSWL